MLRAALRSTDAGRCFSKFVPRSPLTFDNSKQITLYTLEDDGALKMSMFASLIIGTLSASYAYFVEHTLTSKILYGLSFSFLPGLPLLARSITRAIHLQSDGRTIHLHTATPLGHESPNPIVINIRDIKAKKTSEGYDLLLGYKTFRIDDNGRIHRPDLLYTVLKGLPIDVSTKTKCEE